MPDPAALSLPGKVLKGPVFRIQIIINIQLTDIVKQVKIKILMSGLFQLFCEDLFCFSEIDASSFRSMNPALEILGSIGKVMFQFMGRLRIAP